MQVTTKFGGTGRHWRSAVFATAALAVVVAASGAAADVLGVIQARQGHFKEIGKAAKAMGDQLKSPTPALPAVQSAVKQIAMLAPEVPSWFPAGSGMAAGVKTQAKPEIWAKPDEFKRDAAAFAEAAHKLDLVAAGGDLSAIRAQAQALGQTCKTCHETFRQRDD
jgi:cytochrome c556